MIISSYSKKILVDSAVALFWGIIFVLNLRAKIRASKKSGKQPIKPWRLVLFLFIGILGLGLVLYYMAYH
jgi:hypothetical protein